MSLSDLINSVKKGYEATNDIINIAKDKYEQVENQIGRVKEIKQKRDIEKAKERMVALEGKLKKYIVAKPGIVMREDEICYYQGKAVATKTKNVVVGTVRNSQHVGVNAFHVYSGGGTSVSQSIRGDITDRCKGYFFITNKRIVLNTVRNGFEIPLNKLTGMEFYKDGIVVFANGSSYVLENNEVGKIKKFLEINNEYEFIKMQINDQAEKDIIEHRDIATEAKSMELLREYKHMMDEGIITEEEFVHKKKELLDI